MDSAAPSEGKPTKSRATSAEVAERVDAVLRIRLDGAELHDVETFAKEKGWEVSQRQLCRYIEQADELLVERCERRRRKLIARHIAQRQALYARALNSADYSAALRVLDSLADLQGLFVSSKDWREMRQQLKEQKAAVDRLERQVGPEPPEGTRHGEDHSDRRAGGRSADERSNASPGGIAGGD